MESRPRVLSDRPITRMLLLILVAILLNTGLFFLLNVLAPLLSGCIVGFLASKMRDGMAATFIGTILSYSIIFIVSEWFLGFPSTPFDIATAVLIMGVIGAFGGLIGANVFSRTRG